MTDTDTTDLTTVEDMEEADKKQSVLRRRRIYEYQKQDVSMIETKPGSGEYYGPRTYMPSIEIKSFMFNMITLRPDEAEWTMEQVCQYVHDFYAFYYGLLKKKCYIKHYFFDTTVATPCRDSEAALVKFEQMFALKRMVVAGGLCYAEIKKLFDTVLKKKVYIPSKQDSRNGISPLFQFDVDTNVCMKINDFITDIPTDSIY